MAFLRMCFREHFINPKSLIPNLTVEGEQLPCVWQPWEGGSPSSQGKEPSQDFCISSSTGKVRAASVISSP